MGRSITPKYVIDMPGSTTACWNCKQDGRANEANLKKYMEALLASLKPGGANAHVQWSPQSAVLRENCSGGKVIARWAA